MDHSKVNSRAPPPENTGYTYSHSSSYSTTALDFEKEHRITPVLESPRMSRRSLRLHSTTGLYGDDSLDSTLNHMYHSASFSAGGASRRDSKALKSRRSQQHSVSCSQSLLLTTPLKSQHGSRQHNSSLHSVAASDASLLSSMLDKSCIQERTLVEGFWGLDEDSELKERTMTDSMCEANGDINSAQTQTSMVNGSFCKDRTIHLDRNDALTAYSKHSSTAARSATNKQALTAPAASPSSTIYARDKSRKHRTGVLVSFSDTCVRVSRRAAASVASVFSLLLQSVLLRSRKEGTGVLWSALDTCLNHSRRAAAFTVCLVRLLIQAAVLKTGSVGRKVVNGAHSSYCGSMNVNELGTEGKHMTLNGALCDDCKGKQRVETRIVQSSSRVCRSHHVLGELWLATAYSGYLLSDQTLAYPHTLEMNESSSTFLVPCFLLLGWSPGSSVLWAGQKAGSAVRSAMRRMLSVLWLAAVSPGKSATGAFWWLGTGWYHLATVMSLLNIFVLTRCLPKLLKLLLILLPFLLVLLALWHWGPSSLLSVLPAINITEWRTAYSFSQTPLEPTKDSQPIMAQPPPAVSQPGSVLVSVDSERLARLEHRLAQLWEKVERGGRRQENQHREVLSLYQSVREQLDTQTDKDSMGLWVSGLLEERLLLLKRGMEKDAALRRELSQEIGEQYVVQQQGQESRLAQLEVLLQTLTAKTEEVQRRQADTSSATPALPPVPVQVNVGVDSESRDALLAEVQLLEATLGGIRQDLQGVMGCQGMCDRLDTLHETVSEQVSAQVRTELRALFSRSEQVGESQTREKELPESLLQWLSERYVSGVDVHASLTSLELSILQNVTLQLEKSRARQETHSTETVTQTVMHTVGAAGAGMSEEHVQLIVKNALKLYSQDRTGLVDYALESGGGSILSTRCSETYETKTALMSLFGLPLWYFSQSPRVAIQPDVHPGNCWAFQGSHGYLVIRLSMRIVPSAFSLEHIPKSLSPTGTISSAPRQFTVYGLDDEYQEEGKLLGSYTYQDDEDALQTYPVTEENDKAYQIIEVRVLSNWGHPEYTCLYRIRVHGQPSVN
ncbi:SUN domain-containing protein 1-like isoform X3 [Oncorhynchus nerka]|uniref:SUN domain-containing protein 1-like isoform X3 n=1 Tax=Oncorhynchus nerka TaxID=8023 RepID=UPI00112FDD47|nr:SUN domain-containing protein 1-like isoform X3 [Oncorhynchus nerka]